MNTIKEIRANNINLGRLKSNETNKIKGCISYFEKKKKKQDEYKKKLETIIKENKEIYKDIYNRYLKALKDYEEQTKTQDENNKDTEASIETYLKYLNLKELDILIYLDMKEPEEM